uniref:Fibrinogen C-terminal domain-containing protein n=1 Tax=Plectus sambesii TaxID=2011161 RepID=A0A914X972_9BILA
MLGQSYHLLVQVTDFDGRSKFSVYDKFAVSDELTNYTLSLGKMFGEEEDVDNFLPNRNAPFGTYDYDTDEKTTEVCGALWQSGWWHDPLCRPSGNLNVPYEPSQNLSAPTIGLRWRDDTGSVRVKSVQMKIRPKSFNPLLLVNFRSKNDKNDGGGEPSANGGESSANGGQPSAKGGRLALNFRSLHHSGKKLDGQSTAAWRRYRR